MKRKIVKALFILFLLFTIGGGVSIFTLRQINTDLKNLIALHRVEIIRQDLVINVQSVQSNLFTVGTGLGRELDEIVESVMSLDEAVHKCIGCHHAEHVAGRITDVQGFIEQYKEALSAYITTTANEQRIKRLKLVAADIGEMILERTREMAFIANKSLQKKTEDAVFKVVRIQNLLIVTLLITMLIGFVVAASLTRMITTPINRLVRAAKKISSGDLGYTTDFQDETEFGEFARTFNDMSNSLRDSHNKIVSYTNRLSEILKFTVSLYSISAIDELIKETNRRIKSTINAGYADMLLFHETNQKYCLFRDENGEERLCINEKEIHDLYESANRKAIILNDINEKNSLPFKGMDIVKEIHNLMIVWLRLKGELKGAIIIVNKKLDNFDIEDLKLLSILANNFSVALDNVSLYNDLRRKMSELQETQQQLIQAAKLAAIGELASNVAHEINNPLTSILGYTELLKEDRKSAGIKGELGIIEQESLRAREIVRQLLEFSKKKPLELKETDINSLLKEILKLVTINIKSTNIGLVERYDTLPPIMADSDQLKQVFLNLINNAVAAMVKDGTLTIETANGLNEIFINISDTGSGIDEEALPHIFEPFFTTKEEKGTGLGLSVSYKIVSEHGGKISVSSIKGKGTKFTVELPIKTSVSHVSL